MRSYWVSASDPGSGFWEVDISNLPPTPIYYSSPLNSGSTPVLPNSRVRRITTGVTGNYWGQLAFNCDYSVLYATTGSFCGNMENQQCNPPFANVTWAAISTQDGVITPIGWTMPGQLTDLGGSLVCGGGGGGDCFANLEARTSRTARRGAYFRYRASVKGTNKTMTSVDNLRLEVTLPPEVSVVSSTTSLKKRQGVEGSADNGVMVWGDFNLKRSQKARFSFKGRVALDAVKGQVLTLESTLFQDGAACPQTKTHTVRVWV